MQLRVPESLGRRRRMAQAALRRPVGALGCNNAMNSLCGTAIRQYVIPEARLGKVRCHNGHASASSAGAWNELAPLWTVQPVAKVESEGRLPSRKGRTRVVFGSADAVERTRRQRHHTPREVVQSSCMDVSLDLLLRPFGPAWHEGRARFRQLTGAPDTHEKGGTP